MSADPSRAVPDEEPTLDAGVMSSADAHAFFANASPDTEASELAEKLEEAKRSGGSLGRGLANSAATLYRDRLDDAERELAAIARELGVEPTFDLATHLRGVLASRDAWVDQSARLDAAGDLSCAQAQCPHGKPTAAHCLVCADTALRLALLDARECHAELSSISLHAKALAAESEALRRDKERLDWLEEWPSLHRNTEIYYVVDGFTVDLLRGDGDECVKSCKGENIREAIDVARAYLTENPNG